MRRIKWSAVIAGAVVTLVLASLFTFVVWLPFLSPVDRALIGVFPTFLMLGWLLSQSIGGMVAGRMSSASPGLNAALSGLLAPLLLVTGYLIVAEIIILTEVGFSAYVSQFSRDALWEFLTDEEMGILVVSVLAFAVYLLFATLAGYLGGRISGRLRSSPGSSQTV